ncbi:MAG: tetratricopeptide repeat protein [Nitrospirae bacterium]|nr:tetratricopeptide repeat protein [Nitrospirota bacterium]
MMERIEQGAYARLWLVMSVCLLLLAPVSLTPQARAQEGPGVPPSYGYDLAFTKGVAHFNQHKYREAIEAFRLALAAKANDVDAMYHLGIALSKDDRNQEARDVLLKVLALAPGMDKVHFDLAVVDYNLGNDREALAELALAEHADPNDAMIYYYQGLALHRLGDYEHSAPRFLRAVALSPSLGLTAHYYAGLGFYRRGLLDEARDELSEVIRIDPVSATAKSARELLAQIGTTAQTAKPWDLALSTAAQYDSNVILLDGTSQLPNGISQQHDQRVVFYLRGGYRVIDTGAWRIEGRYSFYQSLHQDLDAFNVQHHQAEVVTRYNSSGARWPVSYELKYTFGDAIVDGNGFLRTHALTPTVTLAETGATFTQLQYGFTKKDFVNTPMFRSNDDRDATNQAVGLSQTVLFAGSGLVRAGYRFDRDATGNSSTQDDWAYRAHQVSAALTPPLPAGVRLDLEAAYTRQRYRHPNSYSASGEARDDRQQVYTAGLSKTFFGWMTASLQEVYTKNTSNIAAFRYDRGISSLTVTASF